MNNCNTINNINSNIDINNTNSVKQIYDTYNIPGYDTDANACSTMNQTSLQYNVIDTAYCDNMIANACIKLHKTEDPKIIKPCINQYNDTVENISQKNINSINNTCIISNLLKNPNIVNNPDLVTALSMKYNNASTNLLDCNTITTNTQLTNFSNCLLSSNVEQSNIIKGCGGIRKVNMLNNINTIKTCAIQNNIGFTTIAATDTIVDNTTETANVDLETVQSSSISIVLIVILLLIILLIIIGIGIYKRFLYY